MNHSPSANTPGSRPMLTIFATARRHITLQQCHGSNLQLKSDLSWIVINTNSTVVGVRPTTLLPIPKLFRSLYTYHVELTYTVVWNFLTIGLFNELSLCNGKPVVSTPATLSVSFSTWLFWDLTAQNSAFSAARWAVLDSWFLGLWVRKFPEISGNLF